MSFFYVSTNATFLSQYMDFIDLSKYLHIKSKVWLVNQFNTKNTFTLYIAHLLRFPTEIWSWIPSKARQIHFIIGSARFVGAFLSTSFTQFTVWLHFSMKRVCCRYFEAFKKKITDKKILASRMRAKCLFWP